MGLLVFLLAAIGLLLNGIVRPGTNVSIRDALPIHGLPSDTGAWFICGAAEQGPTTPVLIRSMQEFAQWFGARATYSWLYDSLDAFFHEGGRTAYVSRVVGPAAALAQRNLLDAGAAISLVAKALGPGVYGNSIKVGVVAGVGAGNFQIQVSDAANVILEQSSDLADNNAAIAWSQNSLYIRLTAGVSANDPAVAALAALAGGTDDRVNITDTQWQNAINMFTEDLGFGQVSFPGMTSDTLHVILGAHAAATHRVAYLDLVDTPTQATLVTAAGNARANGRWTAAFAPWAQIPGLIPNSTRLVPYSAIQAGMTARNDAVGSPGEPVAGENGQSLYSLGLSQDLSNETTRQALNDAGVNVAIVKYGGVRTYGYRTLVVASSDPTWVSLGGVRVLGAFSYSAKRILDQHLFQEVDGQGRLFRRVYGRIAGEALILYIAGDLFGATAQEAFRVVCDFTNNTPATIADRQLNCDVALRTSEMAEMMNLSITRVPVNQPLL